MASAPFYIDPKSLQTQVSSTTFARGSALYRNHAVQDIEMDEVEPGLLELEGEVQGSLPEPYWVNAALKVDARGQVTHFDGHCTCPVVNDCKHAVALALRTAYESAPLQSTAAQADRGLSPAGRQATLAGQAALLAQRHVDQWLEQFADAMPAPVDKAPGAPAQPDQVVYMLAPARRGNDAVLHIGFGLSRPLRKGGWGQVRAMGYGTPASATPQDREAMQLLQTLGAQTYGYSVSTMLRPLGGEVGQLALRLAASTGRLFYAPDGSTLELALALGPARALAWHWQEDHSSPGNPAWVLQARLDGTDAGQPLVEAVVAHAHAVCDALHAQVVAVLGELLAVAQGMHQAVGLHVLPNAAAHWKHPRQVASKQIAWLGLVQVNAAPNNGAMNTQDFDELAGRIDGIGHALLRLTAELEMQGLIDGPRVSQAWRDARPEHLAVDQVLQASRHVLHQLADQLDGARSVRQARGRPG